MHNLNNQNNFPASSGTLAIIGSQDYIYLSSNNSTGNSTTLNTSGDTILQLINESNSYTNTSNNFSLQTQGTSPSYIIGITNGGSSFLYKYSISFSASFNTTAQYAYFRIYQNSTPVSLTTSYIQSIGAQMVVISFIGTLATSNSLYLYGRCATSSDTIVITGTQITCDIVAYKNQ